jgi:hypothetical protein
MRVGAHRIACGEARFIPGVFLLRSSLACTAILVAVASAGCAASGVTPALAVSGDAAVRSIARADATDSEPGANAIGTTPASAGAAVARHLYVGNAATNTITIYDKRARGNVAPVRTIGGPASGITCLRQFAVDSRGFVYVAVWSASAGPDGYCHSNGGGEILVFAPDANGDVAPVRTIAGPATTIANASSVAVAADGSLYVGSEMFTGAGAAGALVRFAPGASGNATPTATATFACENFTGITLDSDGGVIASSAPCSSSSVSANVGYFSRNLSSGGAAISYDDTGPLASDPATHTFLGVGTFFGPRIDRYADGSTGAYAPNAPGGPQITPGLVSSLSIASCPTAVAIGPSRTTYVAGTCPDSIAAFAPDAAGSTAPLRTIVGPATRLASPQYVLVGT